MFDRIADFFSRLGERVAGAASAVGGAITRPIERVVEATFGRIFGALEGFDRIDDWFLGFLRFVTWPVRALGQALAAVLRRLIPRSFVERLASGAERLGGGAWWLIERFNLDGPLRWLAWATQPAWRPVAALGGFAYAWLATREFRKALWGVPALVLMLPVVAAGFWQFRGGPGRAAERYAAARRAALEKEDFDRVEFFERKLAQLNVSTARNDYHVALDLAEKGELDEAYARMQRLAPADRAVMAPAHFWILQNLLFKTLDVPDAERLALVEKHLAHLEKLRVRGPQVDFMRALWLVQSDRLDEGAAALEPLINSNPYAAAERLRIDIALNRRDEARKDAYAVRAHAQDANRRSEKLAPPQLAAWAIAEEILGDLDALAGVVRQWHAADPDNPAARQSLAVVTVRDFNELAQRPNANPQALADRLAQLIELSTNPADYQGQVAKMYANRTQAPVVQATLDALAARPNAPLGFLEALGSAAAIEGDIPLARTLLKRVVDAEPNDVVALNNYGWALMQEPEPDLEAALAAVNRALADHPEEFRFRETRGQVLVRMGRWQEAVDDLEFALNGMPEAPTVHAALAQAYDKLGQADLAAMHREHAQ